MRPLNNNRLLLSRCSKLAAIGASLFLVSSPASAFLISEGFTGPSVGSGTPSGTVNARGSGNAINTGTGNTSFDNFFTSDFLVLGDNAGDIAGNPESGIHSISYGFSVAAITPVLFSFDYGFDGTGPGSDAGDNFLVSLTGPSGTTLLSLTSPSFGSAADGDSFSTLLNLAAGNYTLLFQLSEVNNQGQPFTSAVGLDNIQVAAVPLPPAAWLLGSALVGLGVISRRKEA